jgi:hypothetical protein
MKLIGAINDDFNQLPYVNDQFDSDAHSRYDDGALFSIVFIEDFFTDGRDFAYYVVGRPNVTAFVHGVFGMQAYNGPLTATPMLSHGSEILNDFRLLDAFGGKIQRSHSRMEKVKWKYVFETARLAWSKLRVDPRKLAEIRKRNCLMLSRGERLGCDVGAEWDVHSVTSVEARETDAGMAEKNAFSVEEPSTPTAESSEVTNGEDGVLISTID